MTAKYCIIFFIKKKAISLYFHEKQLQLVYIIIFLCKFCTKYNYEAEVEGEEGMDPMDAIRGASRS